MRKLLNVHFIFFSGLAVAGAMMAFCFEDAQARPLYNTEFQKKYPSVKAAKQAKCATCHVGKPAEKQWNDYGAAMGTALGGKNVKDAGSIVRSLSTIETKQSGTSGKTFGDLLKEGKLPGNK